MDRKEPDLAHPNVPLQELGKHSERDHRAQLPAAVRCDEGAEEGGHQGAGADEGEDAEAVGADPVQEAVGGEEGGQVEGQGGARSSGWDPRKAEAGAQGVKAKGFEETTKSEKEKLEQWRAKGGREALGQRTKEWSKGPFETIEYQKS